MGLSFFSIIRYVWGCSCIWSWCWSGWGEGWNPAPPRKKSSRRAARAVKKWPLSLRPLNGTKIPRWSWSWFSCLQILFICYLFLRMLLVLILILTLGFDIIPVNLRRTVLIIHDQDKTIIQVLRGADKTSEVELNNCRLSRAGWSESTAVGHESMIKSFIYALSHKFKQNYCIDRSDE